MGKKVAKAKELDPKVQARLDSIGADVKGIENELQQIGRKSLDQAIRCGELLEEAKSILGHGPFGKWREYVIRQTTASNYMRLFKNQAMLKANKVESLWDAYNFIKMEREAKGLKKSKGDGVKTTCDLKEDELADMREKLDQIAKSTFQVSITGNVVSIVGANTTQDIIAAILSEQNKASIEEIMTKGEVTIHAKKGAA